MTRRNTTTDFGGASDWRRGLGLPALGLALWWIVPAGVLAADAPGASNAAPPRIEKAFVSFRIGVPQWEREARFAELLALFEKYRGVTDEITLFTSATHPPLPLDVMRRRCEVAAVRIVAAKKAGYRAGINVLSTMGHHNENLPNSLSGDLTRVTDPDGNVSHGSFCPNDPRFADYVRSIYRMAAEANPDYLWVDDDVRLAGHMPIGLTCFCDRCIALFCDETGKKHTRSSVKAGLFEGPEAARLAFRKSWLGHNRATIARLLALIERTVHAVRPGMPLGFMSGERFYEGYDFDGWARALAGPAHAPVLWRPGGGYYEDSSTGALAGKSHEIGRQTSLLPPEVRSIQSEIENFPYHRLRKAARITVLEALSHMGAGCTGAAFNVLSGNDEPLDEFDFMVATIHAARPLMDVAARHFQRESPVGVGVAWDKDSWAGDLGMLGAGPPIWEIGLPAAYRADRACVTILTPQNVAAMTDDQLRRALATGVYTDADTLSALNRRGMGKLTGMAVEKAIPNDCIEELTDHPLNAPFAGRQRDCRQSFYHQPGHSLRATAPGVQPLARLVDYAAKEQAAMSMACFQNAAGGRIVVCGYFPWSFLHNLSKSSQMKSLMRWLSRDRLPGYVASMHKTHLWVRPTPGGGSAVMLINSSFDPADGAVLALRTGATRLRVFDHRGASQVVTAGGTEGPYRRFTLPAIEPWSARVIATEATSTAQP